MHTIKTLASALVAAACLLVAHAADAACMKWSTNLLLSDTDPKFNNPNVIPTDQELEKYYGYLYADSASQVCKQWGQLLYGLNGKVYNTATGEKQCWTDGDGVNYNANGVLDSFDPISPVINYGEIPRESCCEADLEGFHELTPDKWYTTNAAGVVVALNPAAGQSFTFETVGTHPSQISQIRDQNYAGTRGAYVSDLYRPNEGIPAAIKNAEYCGGTLQIGHPNLDCRPEVDHIIPRMDIKGCKCGKNSAKNAQVISRGLNGWLSNYCGNSPQGKLRQKMIEYYTAHSLAMTKHVSQPTYASTDISPPPRGNAGDFILVLQHRFSYPRVSSMSFIGLAPLEVPAPPRSVMSLTATEERTL